ncbi:MAG: hypothetical protein HOV81_33160 [Kofleriaceae bacterium]|nr:hypothetical protein [Kofleriaceae bacterium]
MIAARVPVLVTLLVGFAMFAGSLGRATSMPQEFSWEARQRTREAEIVREITTRIERGEVSCHMRATRPIQADASGRSVDPAQAQIDPFAY